MSKEMIATIENERVKTIESLSARIDREVYDTFRKMSRSIYNLLTEKPDAKIKVLYHADLDGSISAYCTIAAIKCTLYRYYTRNSYKEFLRGAEELKKTDPERFERKVDEYFSGVEDLLMFETKYQVVAKRINYNYDISTLLDGDEDMIFLVDYSLSNRDHKMYLLFNTKANIYWLDHHESSLDIIENDDPDSLDYKFMHNPRVFNAFFTARGASAALLCYRFLMACRHGFNTYYKTPSLVVYTSLYDTFHPLSDRKFSYIGRIVDLDIERLYDTYGGCHVLDFLILTDASIDPHEVAEDLFSLDVYYYNEHPEDIDDSYFLSSIMEKAKDIMQYDINSHNIIRRSQEIEFELNFFGEKFSMVGINAMGNSYLFEESYYNHDAVLLTYLNNKGTYTTSFYSNLDGDHPLTCNDLARQFGGGGHRGAAGCTLEFNILEKIVKDGNKLTLKSYER